MIEAIYWLAIFAVVLVNVTALTLLTLRYIPFPAIARVTGILLVCLALFSLEHFVGLGELYPLFLPLTALSLYVIWLERARFLDENFRTAEIRLSLRVALRRRVATDHHPISSKTMTASPIFIWSQIICQARGCRRSTIGCPYQRLNYYYAFQHYSAALLGRLFGLGPGASFNLAAVILAALVLALAWEFLTILRVRFGLKLLSVAALAIGGTGISPLFHLITSPLPSGFFHGGSAYHDVLYNSRFVGWFDTSVASDAWRSLFGETQRSFLLPIETFGYQYVLGGYHAVLSGFLLLFLALTVIVARPSVIEDRPGTVRISAWPDAAADTVLECVGISSPGGIGSCLENLGSARLGPLGIALSGERCGDRRAWFCFPILPDLGLGTDHMRPQLVTMNERAPFVQFLIVFWPLIVLAVAVPLAGQAKILCRLSGCGVFGAFGLHRALQFL